LRALVDRFDGGGIDEIFVVGGDVPQPVGPYDSTISMLKAMAELGNAPARIGVAGYPERHPLIGDQALHEALAAKQAFASYAVTQICFDPGTVVHWIERIRRLGIGIPVYVGFPGPLKRRKLLEISLRVGVGDSVRYVRKHGGLVGRLLRRPFRPDVFATGLSALIERRGWDQLGVIGSHINTFNQAESAEQWRRQELAAVGGRPGEAQAAEGEG
jgi:methylenetetrahydrofolate reductase (NADPH)